MTIWLPDPNTLNHPLHLGLASAIANAITEGKLSKGQKLPTHRYMADKLGLSVHTVSKAYDNLRRQNLIDGQVGRGSYVLDQDTQNDQPFQLESEANNGFDMSISRPIFSQLHVDKFQRLLTQIPKNLDPAIFLSCRPNIGHSQHRKAGVKWLDLCGLKADPESIIMTNGVTHGMSAALSALTRSGDTVLSDRTTHHLLVSTCAYFGLNLVGIETDAFGIIPDSLEKYCHENSPKVLYLIPSIASPTVYMMHEERRRKLAEIARKFDLYIIENDAFGPVAADRPPPVSTFAPECSIYLTTLTKCTVPGMRVGYLVAPDHLLPALTGRIIVFGWMATPLMCELATRWVLDGTAHELAMSQRAELQKRYEVAQDILQGFDWSGHPSALHLWLNLPDGWKTSDFVAHARQLKVAVAPENPFLTPKTLPQNAVRISLGSIQNPEQFSHAMRLIVGLLKRPQEPIPQFTF
jgi:DNA-binding transcriptional MocR family regulator